MIDELVVDKLLVNTETPPFLGPGLGLQTASPLEGRTVRYSSLYPIVSTLEKGSQEFNDVRRPKKGRKTDKVDLGETVEKKEMGFKSRISLGGKKPRERGNY